MNECDKCVLNDNYSQCDEKLTWKDKLILTAAGIWCLLFIVLAIIGAIKVVDFMGWI